MTTISQGFDLDAIPANAKDGDEVVYEVGGGASKVEKEFNHVPAQDATTTTTTRMNSPVIDPRLELSEQFKLRGNQEFLAKNFMDAYDSYTEAIEACPGMKGEELLALKKKHDEVEQEKAYAHHTHETMRRRKTNIPTANDDKIHGTSTATENPSRKEDTEEHDKEDSAKYTPTEFQVPKHDFAEPLSIYYSNRAACSLHLTHYDTAIQDCDVALLLHPKYTKALIRRMTAYENLQRTEEALRDAKTALEYEPKNKDIQKHVQRLKKLENERLEKLKEETMGKLKDLGNSVLGYFGLSLDNFKADKDPNTGSYNISFQQNK